MAGRVGAAFAGTDRFEIKRRLGAGGMGVVYEAYDRERDTAVALKTLRHIDASTLARFKREFRALQHLEHPNLISLGELVADAGEWFFTMELVDGKDFLAYVRPCSESNSGGGPSATGPPEPSISVDGSTARGASQTISGTSPTDADPLDAVHGGHTLRSALIFDEARLRAILSQLALGIDVLHRGGKLHRDIKPSNILITSSGRLVLLDFGLVTDVAADRQSSTTSMVGTAEYVAPEQALGRVVGPAADWYSMGVVLYEALTRRLPHVGVNAFDLLVKKQERPPLSAQRLVPDVPRDLNQLCEGLLQIDPGRRPSGQEILEQLAAEDAVARTKGAVSVSVPLSSSFLSAFVQDIPFVGREQELEVLRRAFDDSRKGAPVSVFVHGESGVGKSELLGEFTRELIDQSRGGEPHHEIVVLQGRCYERESVPYKAFDGIADSLSRYLAKLPDQEVRQLLPLRAGLLPHLFPALQQVKSIASARMQAPALVDPQERRTRMFQAFRELLARLADLRPVVMVIDDFQWAGLDSLTMLEEVMHATEAPSLLLLGTARPGTEELLAKHSSGDVRHVQLQELSVDHARELASRLAPGLDGPQVQAIVAETSGHPLFILELVRHFSEGGTAGAMRLDDALWARIGGLAPATRLLLEVLAVGGAPLAQDTAAAAAGLAYAEYEKAVRSLRIGFLARTKGRGADTVEPYHDRIREAVLARLDEATRTRHHRELASALERSGVVTSDPQVLVRHLVASGQAAQAAAHAETAASRANAISAYEQAAELYTTVLSLGGQNAARTRELRLALGASLVAAGRGPEAADVFQLAAEGADAAVRLECQRQAAEQLLISGHLERGVEGITRLLAHIGVRLPETPRRALLSLLWQRAKLRLRGLRWKEKYEGQFSAEQLTRLDVYRVVSHGLGIIDNIRGSDFQARGLLLALRIGERARVAQALFYEGAFVASSGPRSAARARALLQEGARVAAPLDDPYLAAWEISGGGFLAYFNGRYRPAAERLAKAEAGFRESAGATWERNTVRLFHLWSLHRLGALAELQPLLREYLRDAKRCGDRYVQTTLLRSCPRVLLATNTVEGAQQELAQTHWVPSKGRYHLQHWLDFYARAEIALYTGVAHTVQLGVREETRRIHSSFLLRVTSIRVEFYCLRARLLLVSARDKKALRQCARLARRLEQIGFAFSSVLAKLLRAAVAVQRARLGDARTILRLVIDDATHEEMFLHAAAAQRRLAELVGGDEATELYARAKMLMGAQGVADAASMTELLAPGFSRDLAPAALLEEHSPEDDSN